jgi:hypothetical protein
LKRGGIFILLPLYLQSVKKNEKIQLSNQDAFFRIAFCILQYSGKRKSGTPGRNNQK